MKDKEVERECKTHGITAFVLEGRGYYRCKKCRMDAVKRRRKKVKAKLVEHFGGKCMGCGYDRCVEAMEFHHLDAEEKDFAVSNNGNTYSCERLKKEAEKCVLLCANCHREVHAGVLNLSDPT